MERLAPENWLPDWASGKVNNHTFNGYRILKGQLNTKDGRRTGNAVVVSHHYRHRNYVTRVITDAGNSMFLSENEIEELFYEPEYIMTEYLPAVKALLQEEADSNG
jgi:hypothetical protein